MFFIVMFYAVVGAISLLGSFLLIKNGPRFMGMNVVYGVAQLILIITLLLYGLHGGLTIELIISLILGLVGVANLVIGFCRKSYINPILGVSQLYLYVLLL